MELIGEFVPAAFIRPEGELVTDGGVCQFDGDAPLVKDTMGDENPKMDRRSPVASNAPCAPPLLRSCPWPLVNF